MKKIKQKIKYIIAPYIIPEYERRSFNYRRQSRQRTIYRDLIRYQMEGYSRQSILRKVREKMPNARYYKELIKRALIVAIITLIIMYIIYLIT